MRLRAVEGRLAGYGGGFAIYHAAGPPGVVAGIDLALREFGKLSWSDVSPPAIKLAEEGVVVRYDVLQP